MTTAIAPTLNDQDNRSTVNQRLTDFQRAFLTEWATDLKTTDAAQGTGALCTINTLYGATEFCCLGRAALILQQHHADWLTEHGFRIEYRDHNTHLHERRMFIIDVSGSEASSEGFAPTYTIESDGVIPARLATLLGLGPATLEEWPESTATTEEPGALGLSQEAFYGANDDKGRSFAEIGNAIDMALANDRNGALEQLDYAYDEWGDEDDE